MGVPDFVKMVYDKDVFKAVTEDEVW